MPPSTLSLPFTLAFYGELASHHREIALLNRACMMLDWDLDVNMRDYSAKAKKGRAEENALLAKLVHEKETDKRQEEWLKEAKVELKQLDEYVSKLKGAEPACKKAKVTATAINEVEQLQKEGQTTELTQLEHAQFVLHRSVADMERKYEEAVCLDTKFVEVKKRQEDECQGAFEGFKENDDWEGYRPLLQKVFAKAVEESKLRAEKAKMKRRKEEDEEKLQIEPQPPKKSDPNLPPVVTFSTQYSKQLPLVHPLDFVLETTEVGMRVETLDGLFGQLKSWLPDLINSVIERQKAILSRKPLVDFTSLEKEGVTEIPAALQREMGAEVAKLIGFDFTRGRMDASEHPFSTEGNPNDLRITADFGGNNFLDNILSIVHETGHALYEMNLPGGVEGEDGDEVDEEGGSDGDVEDSFRARSPLDLSSLPAGAARSAGIHESQSLFMEMQIGRGQPFMHLLQPYLVKCLLGEEEVRSSMEHAIYDGNLLLKNSGPQSEASKTFVASLNFNQKETLRNLLRLPNLVRLAQRVQKSHIRMNADECTYPTHVMLRYEIERGIFEARDSKAVAAKVAEIPNLWEQKLTQYLGLSTKDETELGKTNHHKAVLDDDHWAGGCMGIFPGYTLGAVYAAQFMHACRRDLEAGFEQGPSLNVDELVKAGNLKPIRAWLRKHVWSKGSLYSVDEILVEATGEKLNLKFFEAHLRRRYLEEEY
eukprot:TRINITY_DN51128_c0_g1_i1.p1 TRINITY_DN51128_c0_g1~~TRINITY_DN51128_c0_g1_i1.p1  ORF type:complete len:708 (+),score=138.07 TRINITY_DN51128_c0_g1_i1:39-2162(+)